jgi:hypothetical protein
LILKLKIKRQNTKPSVVDHLADIFSGADLLSKVKRNLSWRTGEARRCPKKNWNWWWNESRLGLKSYNNSRIFSPFTVLTKIEYSRYKQ